MKFFTFKQKVNETVRSINPSDNLSVKLSRDENGDFRADCSDGTVIIGGFNTLDFTVYRAEAITF